MATDLFPGVYDNTGSTTTGLFAFDNDHVQNLYSVDTATGATTLVGPTGLNTTGYTGFADSTGAASLYVALGFPGTSILYSLDTNTGAATLIGNTGIEIESMVFEDGILWAGVIGNTIYTVNPATGASTFVTTSVSLTTAGFGGVAAGLLAGSIRRRLGQRR